MTRAWRATWVLALAACTSVGALDDAAVIGDAAGRCTTDRDCDDGVFCNGAEHCATSVCTAASSPCTAMEMCDERSHTCSPLGCTTPDADGDGVRSLACGGTDCDDADRDRRPGGIETCDPAMPMHDEDCDPCTVAGAGDGDLDHDGYVAARCANAYVGAAPACDPMHTLVASGWVTGTDCQDDDPNVHPSQPESCNAVDDDCDGMIDEGVQRTFYLDADHDGYGDPTHTMLGCAPPLGYVVDAGDCDDGVPSRNPHASEICDGADDDCDGAIDEDATTLFFRDADGDLRGDPSASTSGGCTPPAGYVAMAGDCDDLNAHVYVGAPELCDLLDDDCSLPGSAAGGPDPTEDADGDGHASVSAACMGGFPRDDCDDANVLVHGGALERCDGHDDDCDGDVDEAAAADAFCGTGSHCGAGVCRSDVGLSVGQEHACGLASTGAVCWGTDNDQGDFSFSGLLGDGGTLTDPVYWEPQPVAVLGGSDMVELAAAPKQNCARRTDGSVACWGGYVGGYREAPVAIAGLATVVQLALGDRHACARLLAGQVMCWGENESGQIGDGTFVARPAPVAVSGLDDAIEIAAGAAHTCARRASGAVVCWGANASGQLGDGTTTGRATLASVPAAASALELAAGGATTCARFASGSVSCWGDGSRGQLGTGATGSAPMPMPVLGISDAVQIALGATHACATRADGSARCWGANDHGELGDGTITDRAQPVAVSGLSSAVLGMDAGDSVTCARSRTGEVSCWGRDFHGQLADGNIGYVVASPEPVRGLVDAIALETGYTHTCALRATGEVVCWGANDGGQLGDGTNTASVLPVTVVGVAGATGLATGGEHSCAIDGSGGLLCWGSNEALALGSSATHQTCRNVAYGHSYDCSPVPIPVAGIPPVVALVAGGAGDPGFMGDFNCALDTSGAVWCWGSDGFGELGDGAMGTTRAAPLAIAGLSGVAEIAAGVYHACARLGTGELRCWGVNGEGQIGDGTTTNAPSPVAVVGITDALSISGGNAVTCASRSSARTSCWGLNRDFELGTGVFSLDEPLPVDVASTTDAIATAGGRLVGCALHATGTVSCWGAGYGLVGDGAYVQRQVPVPLSGLAGVTAIRARDDHVCALLGTGGVSCWGDNRGGELGTGALGADRSLPHLVPGLP